MIVALTHIDKKDIQYVKEQTGEEIIVLDDVQHSVGIIENAEIIIDMGKNITEELIEECPRLKWIFALSAGVDNFPLEKIAQRGILLSNVRGIHATNMAEQVMGIMINFSRKLDHFMKMQMQKKWDKTVLPDELYGKTLCIIGAGSIGSEIARKAKAFDMKVIGLKKTPCQMKYFDEVWGIDRLDHLLSIGDYIVLITPLTKETYGLIGRDEFKKMKQNSIFINISRGDTVDGQALIDALKYGQIAGAALDVFHREPLPNESPLWGMDNVIITPHSAGSTPFYMMRAMHIFADEIIRYRRNLPFVNLIDINSGY